MCVVGVRERGFLADGPVNVGSDCVFRRESAERCGHGDVQ